MNIDINTLLPAHIRSYVENHALKQEHVDGHTTKINLHLNENPYNAPFNRYPYSQNEAFVQFLSSRKGVRPENVVLGNGIADLVDILCRCLCDSRKDNIVVPVPSCDIYSRCAEINGVECREIPLDSTLQLNAQKVLKATDQHTKIIFLSSPNDPTGISYNRNEIVKVIESFHGIVVVDESYSDYSAEEPLRRNLRKWPNLVVLNRMDHAWALASLRLAMAFATPELARVLNIVKPEKLISTTVIDKATELLSNPTEVLRWLNIIVDERQRMVEAFKQLKFVDDVFDSHTNFIMLKVANATRIHDYLLGKGIRVASLANTLLCADCLRITVGSRAENAELLSALRAFQ